MSDPSSSFEPVPEPDREVIEGKTWQVRPTLLTTNELSRERMRRVGGRLSAQGIRCSVGWVSAVPGQAVTASILLDAETPGAAGDVAIRLLMEASAAEGIDTPVLQEVEVVPAWRDERDWSV